MHKFTKALAAIGLAAVMSQSAMAENLKLGFLVKQPETRLCHRGESAWLRYESHCRG